MRPEPYPALQLYLLLIAFVGGFVLSIYPTMAARKGWRVWRSLRTHGGATASVGFASMAGSVILIVMRAEWWEIALILALGVGASFLLVFVLKSTVQTIALALIAFGWLWFVLVDVRW